MIGWVLVPAKITPLITAVWTVTREACERTKRSKQKHAAKMKLLLGCLDNIARRDIGREDVAT